MRTIRAAFVTALTWGVAWAIVGLFFGLAAVSRGWPESTDLLRTMSIIITGPTLVLGIAGMLSGATFAAVMSRGERGKTLEGVSMWRAGGWGAVGGLVFSVVSMVLILNRFGFGEAAAGAAVRWIGTATTLGVLSAAGSLAIARKGTPGLLEEAAEMQRLSGLRENAR